MTTLSMNRIPISEGLSSRAASSYGEKTSKLAYEALSDLGSAFSFSSLKHELFGLHLKGQRGEIDSSIDVPTLMTALNFLTAMPKHLPSAEVSFDGDGEVLFDWAQGLGRMLTVSLRRDGRLSYAVRFGSRRSLHGKEFFAGTFPSLLSEFIEQLATEEKTAIS